MKGLIIIPLEFYSIEVSIKLITVRFAAPWNSSEISVEFSASLKITGIPVELWWNSTDFFSRVKLPFIIHKSKHK